MERPGFNDSHYMEAKYKMIQSYRCVDDSPLEKCLLSNQLQVDLHQFAHSFEWNPQLNAQSRESDRTARTRAQHVLEH